MWFKGRFRLRACLELAIWAANNSFKQPYFGYFTPIAIRGSATMLPKMNLARTLNLRISLPKPTSKQTLSFLV